MSSELIYYDDLYLDLTLDEIPCSFSVDFGGTVLSFEINYNCRGDFFTVTVRDVVGDLIVTGRKMVYGNSIFSGVPDSRIPAGLDITPWDVAGKYVVYNWDSFRDVKLFIEWGEA